MSDKNNININLYFDEDCIIKNEYYNGVINLIKCKFCNNILKEPMMCKTCHESFCKICTKKMKKNKNEIHPCKNPSYVNNINLKSIIGKIKYLCKNCKKEIKQEDIESHVKEGCIEKERPSKLMEYITRKNSLRKLSNDERRILDRKNKKINHISSKIILYFISFYLI